jgi:hypothetical protein
MNLSRRGIPKWNAHAGTELHCQRLTHVVVILHRASDNRSMKPLQAFQFQLQPNGVQQRDMRRFAGAYRFVFNQALALQKERHDRYWGR